jgi:hypothetical protein
LKAQYGLSPDTPGLRFLPVCLPAAHPEARDRIGYNRPIPAKATLMWDNDLFPRGNPPHTLRLILLLAILLPGPAGQALAWGVEGHEIIAAMAARQLSARASAQVRVLLGGAPAAAMIADANWADEVRDQRPEISRWHYVNIPIAATGYDASRDCPGDDCAVAQIGRDLATLANRRLAPARRAEALRFLIHLVGDIHQPLHAADNNDRGGNDIQVRIAGQSTNMHHLWDTLLVQASGRDPMAVANRIADGIPAATWRAWQGGTPATWANESLYLARRDIYAVAKGRRRLKLDRGYSAREAPVVRIQLARAAARLSWLLNRTLD